MCGRYQFGNDKDIAGINEIIEQVNDLYYGNIDYKTGEIFPTNQVPILAEDHISKKTIPQIMRWGFPKWDGKGVIINAKSETATDKKTFSKPLRDSRCVIPSTGFYEWQKKDPNKPKDKQLFTMPKSEMLYMAGLYKQFKIDDSPVNCFVILTGSANSYMEKIHDRMPVILYEDELNDWIFDDSFKDYLFLRNDVELIIEQMRG